MRSGNCSRAAGLPGVKKYRKSRAGSRLSVLGSETNHACRRLLRALEHHLLQRAGLGEQRAQQLVVEGVPGLVRAIGAKQRPAQQVQVADRVEQLVADELVGEAQPVRVEHTVLV